MTAIPQIFIAVVILFLMAVPSQAQWTTIRDRNGRILTICTQMGPGGTVVCRDQPRYARLVPAERAADLIGRRAIISRPSIGFANPEVARILSMITVDDFEYAEVILRQMLDVKLAVELVPETMVTIVETADFFKAPLLRVMEWGTTKGYWTRVRDLAIVREP